MYVAGLDLGSAVTKAVITGMDGKVLSKQLTASGGNYQDASDKVIRLAADSAGISVDDLSSIVATGLGAKNAPASYRYVTEISCQGKGIVSLFPSVRTVIDIGGAATKIIRVDKMGQSLNFVISEKCATGSGRFLQVIARVLNIGVADIGPLSLKATRPVHFTTNCAVFAESEVISRIAEGAKPGDILAGMHRAMASKVENLVSRIGLEPDCAITGGGALDVGLILAVQETLGVALTLPDDPQFTTALGAAVLAAKALSEGKDGGN